jgi:serine/threonine-protein kinase
MDFLDQDGRNGSCPPVDVLRAFSLGDLEASPFDFVARHVQTCPACETMLDQLHGTSDPLVDRLRRIAAQTLNAPPPLSPPASLPLTLGPYRLIQVIGEGGMGVVYKARQERPDRLVAVKMLLGGVLAGPAALTRMRTEIRAAGRLNHPAIVPVYDQGEEAGRPYFVMEYLPGGTLDQRLRRGPMSEREAAELVLQLARAVQAAHQENVVHRDLKPGNVLLTAEGAPKLSDFGLAVLLDASTRYTQTQAVLGTPAYMAPEQARGETANAGPLTDVYGLGAILYETLTGRPPFAGAGREKILEQVRSQEPVPPSRLRPGLARELEAICLRCLEKEPCRRYASARELAEELANWLAGKPTRARLPGWLRRAGRAALRRPVLAAVVSAVLLGTGVGAAALTWNPPSSGQGQPTADTPSPDPEQPLRELRARLAAGKSVKLIDAQNAPGLEPRWAQGGDVGKTIVRGGDGTFMVLASVDGLLELVRDPGVDRFRLSAEVRHRQSSSLGASCVGLFAACRAYPGEKAPRHFFVRVSFTDHYPELPQGNNVYLKPVLSSVQDGRSRGIFVFAGPSALLFKPQTGVWRKLELEVTPDAIRGWWGDAPQLVGELRQQNVEHDLLEAQRTPRRQPLNGPQLDGIDTRWTARGGLGLFVNQAHASFRNVVLSPLPPPP